MEAAASSRLIWRAVAGDSLAFGVLMEPLYDDAFRLALALVGDRGTAEDVVQDSLLRAWRFIPRFRPDRPLRPWFLKIVANRSRTAARGWRRRQMVPLAPLTADVPTRDSAEVVDLHRALSELRHSDRLIVMLRFYFDMDYAEIAGIAGTSQGAARARVSRATRDLRARLRDDDA